MRYVSMVVAIGLLVVGVTAYAAQAAQKEAPIDSHLLFRTERASVSELKASAVKGQLAQETAVNAARVQQIQYQQQQEKKNQDALATFGQWGPFLVEAAEKYGQDPASLYRVMICESRGDPNADNGVCKGLFQFNPNTWAGTPYGGESIYDGQAQIMAAAWMFSQGRKGEWTCQ